MCTVTYIPAAGRAYLSSTRDEKLSRSKALAPAMQEWYNGVKMIFPLDPQGGGSWIALKENGHAAVLLNGAFQKHQPRNSYAKSRGQILLEVLAQLEELQAFTTIDLSEIEPFTIILFVKHRLYECRWDGTKKFIKELNVNQAYIWSSVTLYSTAVSSLKEDAFKCFLSEQRTPDREDIIKFHRNQEANNGLPTGTDALSVSLIELAMEQYIIFYEDTLAGTRTVTGISIETEVYNEDPF